MTPQALLAPARLAGQPILRSQSDERLVDLVRAGYEPAFEAVVARYRRPLLRYCERFLSEERAEDVVQQSFVSAYDSMLRGGGELKLRPWLYRIVHNTALNALRDRGLAHEELDENYDGVERPDQAFDRRQGLREVIAAVQALPERQRDAIVLRELEGRSYDEIAGELGVTDGSVRQLLNRARTTLRAGATAVTPVGLLTRIPWAESVEPPSARIAELVAGAGAGTVAAKACATALVTGAVVSGVAATTDEGERDAIGSPGPAVERTAGASGPAEGDSAFVGGDDSGRDRSGREGGAERSGSDSDDDSDDRSGPGGDDDDRSGPGDGDDDRSGSSGPGSGDDDELDNSGPGSGSSGPGSGGDGTDNSGSGSGGDSSGSGSGGDIGSNSGSGSLNSGSGTSGSGTSGSGISGSGTSGSGSSGSDSD